MSEVPLKGPTGVRFLTSEVPLLTLNPNYRTFLGHTPPWDPRKVLCS